MKHRLTGLFFLSSLFVGWTTAGCLVITEDNKNEPADTIVVQDTTGSVDIQTSDSSASEDVLGPQDTMNGDVPSAMFELVGDWSTNYGESYSISNEMWGPSSIHAFDNDANWAVTQYSEDDEWNANLFAKQVWTDIDEMGFFYQCTVLFSAATYEEAVGAEDTADYADLEEAGCSGFPWTKFGPPGAFDE